MASSSSSSSSCAGSITAHLYFIAGTVLGVVGVLYVVASKIVRARRADKSEGRLPTFYINLVLKNKSEVIKESVKKKIGHGVFGIRQKIAGSIASKIVTDTKFSAKVASKLAKGIPEKMALRHVDAETTVCFVKDNYAVISCSIVSVDTMKLLGEKLDPKKMSKFNTMLNLLGSCGLRDSTEFALESQMAIAVEEKLREAMADEIMLKLKNESGLESEVELKSETTQPHYFYNFLANMSAGPLGGEEQERQ